MACHDKYWCYKFKTYKNIWSHKKSWIAIKICDTLLPNGMPYHHHMEQKLESCDDYKTITFTKIKVLANTQLHKNLEFYK
jgi:hypothetical protein